MVDRSLADALSFTFTFVSAQRHRTADPESSDADDFHDRDSLEDRLKLKASRIEEQLSDELRMATPSFGISARWDGFGGLVERSRHEARARRTPLKREREESNEEEMVDYVGCGGRRSAYGREAGVGAAGRSHSSR